MRIKRVTRAAAILSMALVGASVSAQPGRGADSAAGRPNILLVIGDDFGMDVTSDMYPGLIDRLVEQYGPKGLNHPDYRKIAGSPASTPTLDHLARQGVLFTNAWAHPFCSPTRASIITGLFAAGTKVTTYQDALSQEHTTFVQLLKNAGYRTGMFGKWHLAGLPGQPVDYPGIKPKEAGFDVFRGNLHAAITTYWDYDYQVQDADTPANEWRNEKPPERSLPGIAKTTYAPVVKVADTIRWIQAQEAADADRPWFAWMAFNLSHATIQRTPSQMAVPNADTLDAGAYAEMKACGGKFGTQDTGNCSGESQMRAMTNSMDNILGKLLEAVDAIDTNTYVIYISDNGTPMYGRPNLDFIDNMYITRSGRGKGTAYESGAHVAMTIRGPGIQPNTESDAYVHAVDIYATVLELAGLKVPRHVSNSDGTGTVPLDGRSLAPILFDGAREIRDPNEGYLLTETVDLMKGGRSQIGARNATHKVVCTNGADMGDCEFYDLIKDPLEEYPLATPENCAHYSDGSWTSDDEPWHYCRLTEVVRTKSFL
jgi:arylsulfatase A-like enzyme